MAASGLRAKTACDPYVPTRAAATLEWVPAEERGDLQRVEVTIYSFDEGPTTRSGGLRPTVDRFVLEQLSGQAIHYWRVLTRHGDRWTASEVSQFSGPTCAADLQP